MNKLRLVWGAASGCVLAAASMLLDAERQEPVPPVPASVGAPAVLVGAGDIAHCSYLGGAQATALLLDRIEGTVLTLGDHAYETGTPQQFKQCYEPTWGRHKARTRPAAGNHDYLTGRGGPYFDYFGDSAGPRGEGYYSYKAGEWHVVVLNSNLPAGPGSPQIKWLRENLEENKTACTLAYWHVPVFSSGEHGNSLLMREAWNVLHKAGADVVLGGHDHDYERFAPQDPSGRADPKRGIRQFVVGTGGGGVYRFNIIRANSEVRNYTAYGVLKLTLRPTSYDWEFIPAGSQTFRDSGSSECVNP
jgi:hypothetical protein